MKGNVKWYNQFKGFGFIVGEDGKDVFVHSTALPSDIEINENDSVEYTIEESERGPKATNVKKLKDN
jgi:CspA family cold shock protein